MADKVCSSCFNKAARSEFQSGTNRPWKTCCRGCAVNHNCDSECSSQSFPAIQQPTIAAHKCIKRCGRNKAGTYATCCSVCDGTYVHTDICDTRVSGSADVARQATQKATDDVQATIYAPTAALPPNNYQEAVTATWKFVFSVVASLPKPIFVTGWWGCGINHGDKAVVASALLEVARSFPMVYVIFVGKLDGMLSSNVAMQSGNMIDIAQSIASETPHASVVLHNFANGAQRGGGYANGHDGVTTKAGKPPVMGGQEEQIMSRVTKCFSSLMRIRPGYLGGEDWRSFRHSRIALTPGCKLYTAATDVRSFFVLSAASPKKSV